MAREFRRSVGKTSVYRDIFHGLLLWRIWLMLAWEDFKNTYSRSLLGVAWVMISFSGFVLVKIIIFSEILVADDTSNYSAYLLLGFFNWQYINQIVQTSSLTFINSTNWIKNDPLPLSMYIYRGIAREFLNVILCAIVVIGVLIILKTEFTITSLWALPGLLFLVPFSFGTKLVLGLLSARFRDVSHLIRTVMSVMMFLSPVFWLPHQMGGLMKYLWWNPFYHLIEIFRSPIIDHKLPVESWYFSGGVLLFCMIVALPLFKASQHKLVFWL